MMRNNVKNEDGTQARNTTGSCVALALAAVTGMTYEQSTQWHYKHTDCSKVTKFGQPHVAGVKTVRNIKAYATKLGRPVKVTKLGLDEEYLNGSWNFEHTNRDELMTRGYTDFMPKRMKVATFAKKFPKGRHIVLVNRHAIAVINGQVVNNGLQGSYFDNQIIKWFMTL